MLSATVFKNILLSITASGGSLQRKSKVEETVSEIATKVGLDTKYLKRFVSNLSGGNQQKVMFGKAFGKEYEIYIFDEPTVGVDMGTRAQLYQVIKKLTESGKAVVIISSDLSEALSLSHKLFVFSFGKITAELTGEAINEATVLGHFFKRQPEVV